MTGVNLHQNVLFDTFFYAYGWKALSTSTLASVCLSTACVLSFSIFMFRSIYNSPQRSSKLRSSGPPLGQPQCAFKDEELHRKKVLASLRGTTIRIPSMSSLFQHLPTRVHPELDRLRIDVKKWLDSTLPPGKRLDALQASDFGYFGAIWWPSSPFHLLRAATYLHIWLFYWDDEIDLADGAMWNEFSAAQIYRNETLSYLRFSLGIDPVCPPVKNPIILNFAAIGEVVRERYDLNQRMRVYEEMRIFMEMSEHEQRMRLTGAIPSVEEYWRYRLGSSAVAVSLAVIEFSLENMSLPSTFHEDDDVKNVLLRTNTIISATNDLVSVKKEIKRDAIDSLIPIIYSQTGDVHAAVSQSVHFIAEEIKSLDASVANISKRFGFADEKLKDDVGKFIEGCKYYITGNFVWSLVTERYGVEFAEDGSGDIILTL